MRKIKQFKPGSKYSFKKLAVFAAAFATIGVAALVLTKAATPYEADVIANTVNPNPTFANVTSWNFVNVNAIAQYDATTSRSADGSGSALFHLAGSAGYRQTNQTVIVEKNTLYTVTAWTKQDTWPSGHVSMLIKASSAGPEIASVYVSPNKAGQWSQHSLMFSSGESTSVELVLARYNPTCTTECTLTQPPETANDKLWVDEVRVIKGARFDGPPAPKTAFEGSQTRIDSLGNWQVKENGAWVDWFPMCGQFWPTAPITTVTRYQNLKNQGFNCEGWTNIHDEARLIATKAGGLRTMVAVSPYMNPGFQTWGTVGNITHLKQNLDKVNSAAYADNISAFYWDNENSNNLVSTAATITDTIKSYDRDPATGKRRRPIMQLSGSYSTGGLGFNRAGEPMSDSIGAYSGFGNSGGVASGGNGQYIMDRMPSQTQPGAYCQLSAGLDKLFRVTFYRCLASGSKAMSYWGDGPIDPRYNLPLVESHPWWGDLPAISRELKQMMDAKIIQAPHHTNWTATIDGSQNSIVPIIVGTRQTADGTGYLIIANNDKTSYTKSIVLNNMPYQVGAVQDFFTGQVVGTVSGGKFTMTISPSVTGQAEDAASIAGGAHVLRLVKSGTVIPTAANYNLQVTSLTASPVTPKVGEATTLTAAVKNAGTDAVPAGTLGVSFSVNGTRYSSGTVTGTAIAPGQSITVTSTTTYTGGDGKWRPAEPGLITIEAFVDESNQFKTETNENDNKLSKIVAVAAISGTPNAAFVSQSVPTTVAPGATFQSTITLTNNGNMAWIRGHAFKLGSENPIDNGTWGTGRWELPNDVPVGGTVTIPLTLKAPSTPGTYNFQWRMLNAVQWFGAYSTNIAINVGSAPATTICPNGAGTAGVQSPCRNVTLSTTAATTIEAEEFDNGGQGISYHDTTPACQGAACSIRPGHGVDLDYINDPAPNRTVGYTQVGEYLEYTFSITTAGYYSLKARTANLDPGGEFQFQYMAGTTAMTLATVAVPDTNSWSVFADTAQHQVYLGYGTYVFRITMTKASSPSQAPMNFSSFTLTPVGATPVGSATSLYATTDVPASQLAIGPAYAVTTGIKVSSSQAGSISGVRWYKIATDTGSHVVSLWSSTGTLLAQATATSETAVGWQQANFATPVAVAANTQYVASVHHPNGSYGYTSKGLLNGLVRSPLTAAAGSNGVYTYNAASTFPATSYDSTNYFVDVNFVTSSTTTLPLIAFLALNNTLTTTGAPKSANPPLDNVSFLNAPLIRLKANSANASGAVTYTFTVNGVATALTTSNELDFGKNGIFKLGLTARDAAGRMATTSFTLIMSHPDVNRDGLVNVLDATVVSQSIGTANAALIGTYDLSRNGAVDAEDVNIVNRYLGGVGL